MKPKANEIEQTVADFGALKYFPADQAARLVVMRLLAAMVGTSEQLAWLRSVMVNRVGEWPGTAELRALFATRFRPADGIEGKGYCTIAGHTPSDIEAERLVPPPHEALPAPEIRQLAAAKRLV